MSESEPSPWSSPAARQRMNNVAFSSLIGGGLMAFIGFYQYAGMQGVSDVAIYNVSVAAFVWTMKIGGGAMLLAGGLGYAGWRHALPLDAGVAGLAGGLMALEGGIWVVNGDLQGILLLIFGAMFLHAARGSWRTFQAIAVLRPDLETPSAEAEMNPWAEPANEDDRPGPDRGEVAGDAPGQEAPARDEPPPEGFLADLGKSDPEQEASD